MKRLIFLTVGMCLLISSAQVQAQTWSPAEKEVLQAIDDCQRANEEENLEAWMACFHDDYVSFGYGSPNTWNKADERKRFPLLVWANYDCIESWIKPLAIRIVGDVAIIHYYLYKVGRDKDGKDTDSRARWTDIMVKQGGKWVWIAAHGGSDPGVKPSGEE